MKRTVKKQFWLSRDEAQELQKKATRTCLSEAALFRLLVRDFEPKEKPDDRFYDVMRQLSAIGNNLHQLTGKANALGFLDMQKLNAEAERWHSFQADVERQFLRPEKSDLKWQSAGSGRSRFALRPFSTTPLTRRKPPKQNPSTATPTIRHCGMWSTM